MHRSKEIMLLFALLVVGATLVLWYTFDRRAKNRAAPPPAPVHLAEPGPAPGPAVVPAKPAQTVPPTTAPVAVSAEPVDLTKHERKTIDFTSGKPVVKDSPEDKAAIDAALKDIAEATKDVTFEAPQKKAEPAPAPPKS